MITLFRKIRKSSFVENKVSRYLLYAIGEIILVVIGILIALQINNYNDAKKERTREMAYLRNIKGDLIINNTEIDKFIAERAKCIGYATSIIENFEGKPITDWAEFNFQTISIYNWRKFFPSNNTFQELTNSGNFAIISNDSIKKMLLDLESLNKKTYAEEEHFRYDSEVLIYEPLYNVMDLHPVLQQAMGGNITLTAKNYGDYFKDRKLKNGFLMVILEFSTINGQLQEMKQLSERLIKSIDGELEKG